MKKVDAAFKAAVSQGHKIKSAGKSFGKAANAIADVAVAVGAAMEIIEPYRAERNHMEVKSGESGIAGRETV